jgi:hypothetical protein
MPLAISTGLQIAYVIALVVVPFLGPVTVAELKGLEILVATGFYTLGIAWWIAAFSVAKPETWWAAILWSSQTLPGPKLAGAKTNWATAFPLGSACPCLSVRPPLGAGRRDAPPTLTPLQCVQRMRRSGSS